MKRRPYVRISKISASEDPKCLTPSLDEYDLLKDEAHISLPIEYWIEGYLFDLPIVGKPVVVEREVRNGVKALGVFVTSAVVKVTETGFETQNSIYKLEILQEGN